MKVQIFTYCDFAAYYAGKLCITGACDAICLAKTPATIAIGFIILKLGIEPADEGDHLLKISLIDADGKPIAAPPPSRVSVKFDRQSVGKHEQKSHIQISLLSNILIPRHGEYSLEACADATPLASTPFFVLPIPART